jgi:hypothetical protein
MDGIILIEDFQYIGGTPYRGQDIKEKKGFFEETLSMEEVMSQ